MVCVGNVTMSKNKEINPVDLTNVLMGISRALKQDKKIKSLEYIENNKLEFNKEKLFYNESEGTVTIVYYNPDSDSGGQLVFNKLSVVAVKEILSANDNDDDVEEAIANLSRQSIADIDKINFIEEAEWFVNEPCTCSDNTVEYLRNKFGDSKE